MGNRNKIFIYHKILTVLTTIASVVFFYMSYVPKNYSQFICNDIDSVTTDGYMFYIKFKHNVKYDNISEYFSFDTTAYNQTLTMPPNSSELISFDRKHATLEFIFPFVLNYSGNLRCVPEYRNNLMSTWVDYSRYATRTIPLNVTLYDFSPHSTLSQMKCEGSTIEVRRCTGRNIYYSKGKFVMHNNGVYEFPTVFVSLGSRVIPFDKPSGRIGKSSIVIQKTKPSFSSIKQSPFYSYIVSRFFNSQMLWHTVYDVIIPLGQLIYHYEGTLNYSDQRAIYFYDDDVYSFRDILNPYSPGLPDNLRNVDDCIFFINVFFGFLKSDLDPTCYRSYEAMFEHEYNFLMYPSDGFRQVILSHLNISQPSIDKNHPLVVVQKRNSKRDIINTDELVEHIKTTCSYCEVQLVDFGMLDLREQIQLSASTTVMVGLHGSGLSHVAWMPPSDEKWKSFLIEVLPYKYWCREWYKAAADFAGVQYHSVMNTGRILPEFASQEEEQRLRKCWKYPQRCRTMMCHDILRDQRSALEIDTFAIEWEKILKQLELNKK